MRARHGTIVVSFGSQAMDQQSSPFFAYMFPCVVEDFCKVGFTKNPLARICQFHPRWFEFFDLDSGLLVGADSQREARDLELLLRTPLRVHRARMPMTISTAAGGKTEWLRGANQSLSATISALSEQGYQVLSLAGWLQAALSQKTDELYEWAQIGLALGYFGDADGGPAQSVIDTLDAYSHVGVDVAGRIPEEAWLAYGGGLERV